MRLQGAPRAQGDSGAVHGGAKAHAEAAIAELEAAMARPVPLPLPVQEAPAACHEPADPPREGAAPSAGAPAGRAVTQWAACAAAQHVGVPPGEVSGKSDELRGSAEALAMPMPVGRQRHASFYCIFVLCFVSLFLWCFRVFLHYCRPHCYSHPVRATLGYMHGPSMRTVSC